MKKILQMQLSTDISENVDGEVQFPFALLKQDSNAFLTFNSKFCCALYIL